MGPMSFERDIAAPVEGVWATMTDVSRYAERFSKIDAAVLTSDGSFDVGTRWRETRTAHGRRASVDYSVTECDPHRRYLAECWSGARSFMEYVFLSSQDGTRTTVRVTFWTRGGGLGFWLGSWLFRARIIECVVDHNNTDLADLARACERRSVPSGR
jgi:uncharacterized protein YndB with AHSA1/START domain